jgi:hypothetical protein
MRLNLCKTTAVDHAAGTVQTLTLNMGLLDFDDLPGVSGFGKCNDPLDAPIDTCLGVSTGEHAVLGSSPAKNEPFDRGVAENIGEFCAIDLPDCAKEIVDEDSCRFIL